MGARGANGTGEGCRAERRRPGRGRGLQRRRERCGRGEGPALGGRASRLADSALYAHWYRHPIHAGRRGLQRQRRCCRCPEDSAIHSRSAGGTGGELPSDWHDATHSDTISRPDVYACSTDAHAVTYANAIANSDATANADVHPGSHTDCDARSNGITIAYANADSHANPNANRITIAYANVNASAHTNAHCDSCDVCYTDSHANTFAHANSNTDRYTDRRASANTGSGRVAGLRGGDALERWRPNQPGVCRRRAGATGGANTGIVV